MSTMKMDSSSERAVVMYRLQNARAIVIHKYNRALSRPQDFLRCDR